MSIQYAGGTIVNGTFTQVSGTRAELADWIKDRLVEAGWTSSGSASDYQLTSATTPQNLSCRVRVYDPGSGSCSRMKLSNVGATKTQAGDLFLLPAASKFWRIIANKYQFFVFASVSTAREFACGGIPYLPSFLTGVITECIWGLGCAGNDTDAVYRTGWRTKLHSQSGAASLQGNQVAILNGTVVEYNNTSGGGTTPLGTMTLFTNIGGLMLATPTRRWHDDSLLLLEPLLAFGASSFNSSEAKIRGQLWDSVIVNDGLTADLTLSIDSRTYWTITNVNTGSASEGPGTLCVAVT